MYLADDITTRADTSQLAKAWMLVLGISIGVGFVVGHLGGRKRR